MRLLFKKPIKWDLYNLILSSLFFISLFLYIWLRIDPVLYYQRQEPVFFLDSKFFNDFLAYPGGLCEYISLFLSQSFYFAWLGAVVITLTALLTSLLTKGIIKSVNGGKQVQILHLIPAVLLIVLHTQYQHPLSLSIGLLISLGVTYLYIRFVPVQLWYRAVYFLVLIILLYYIAAGAFLLFTLLTVIYELTFNRGYYSGLSFLFISAAIPYIAANYFFIITLKDAYVYLLIYGDNYVPAYTPYFLYLFFPVVMILSIIYNKLISEKVKQSKFNMFLMKGKLRYVLQIIVIAAGTVILFNRSFNAETKALLQIDYDAKFGNWDKVLQIITPELLNSKLTLCQLNRALYHTGKLSSEMFSYPQAGGSDGLVFTEDIAALNPLLRSDIFFELGHINEAQHWAFEAFAVTGYSSWNLQRIALTSIIKGDDQVAQKCLDMLSKTLLFGDWAKHYQQYLNNKTLLSSDPYFKNLIASMPKTDFIVLPTYVAPDLESILKSGANNKMAFEYLMANYLLKHQLKNFISYVDSIPKYGYRNIPRHYEEAILAYASLPGTKDFNLQKYHIRQTTINNFHDLERIIRSYKRDKAAAYSTIMAKYGNTYWAYLLYN